MPLQIYVLPLGTALASQAGSGRGGKKGKAAGQDTAAGPTMDEMCTFLSAYFCLPALPWAGDAVDVDEHDLDGTGTDSTCLISGEYAYPITTVRPRWLVALYLEGGC